MEREGESKDEILRQIEDEWLKEIEDENRRNGDQANDNFTKASFISRSNGRGRPSRAAREVVLIGDRGSRKHVSYKPGDLKSPLDEWAEIAGCESIEELVNKLRDS